MLTFSRLHRAYPSIAPNIGEHCEYGTKNENQEHQDHDQQDNHSIVPFLHRVFSTLVPSSTSLLHRTQSEIALDIRKRLIKQVTYSNGKNQEK
jgi:hypothetical protein